MNVSPLYSNLVFHRLFTFSYDREMTSLEQIPSFRQANGEVRFTGQVRDEVYAQMEWTPVRHRLRKPDWLKETVNWRVSLRLAPNLSSIPWQVAEN